MAESRVKRENFITVQGWQVADLGLKGNELLIYACIYGFSQDSQSFSGSPQYLADWTNSTKRGVMKNLQSLTEKGLIEKKENIINGVKFCEYRAADLSTLWNKVHYPMEQSSPGVWNKVHHPMEQSSPNNIDNNISNNIDKKIDYQRIADMYHETCVSFPQIRSLSDARKKAIKARLNTYSIDDFKLLFEKAEASDFLKGKNGRDWSANFDWLIKDSNMAKVLDGNYDNKGPAKKAEPKDDPYAYLYEPRKREEVPDSECLPYI